MTQHELFAQLIGIVGATHVIRDRVDLDGRDHDGRGPAGRSLALVRPRTAEEVSQILTAAARSGVAVVPQGARTGLVAGGAADDSSTMLLLSLERMTQQLEIDAINRTARVGAGVALSRLNAAAAAHGLFFPIDLGADPSVGGMIAANTGGARFIRYGDVRRNVLSLELVTSDVPSETLELGRACWKQNDALDLKQLAIGSGGAMGVITAATLALQPRPAHMVTALIALRDTGAIDRLLVTFEREWGMLLTAFEGISQAAYAAALDHAPRLRRPFPDGANYPYFILVELSAGTAFDSAMLEEALTSVISQAMEKQESAIADVVVDQGESLWAMRHAVPEGLRAIGTVIGCDIALRRGDVTTFRREMAAQVAREWPNLLLCDFGHVGDGGLHFNLVWPTENGPVPTGLADTVRMQVFAAVVERYGGSFSAEHGLGPRNMAAYHRFTQNEAQRLAGSIQSLFAPVAIGRIRLGPQS